MRVGLTGSLAAGKSAVGRRFEANGAVLIDADELAREAVRPGSPALQRIRERWGEGVLNPDGSLDRAAMRAAVFGDDEARGRLEEIVHAGVRSLREARHAAAADAPVIVDEIPLLFELGMEDEFDAIVVVDAAPDERRRRAMAARGWTAVEFDAIEASQMPAADKVARADHVIRNDGDRASLRRGADAVWRALASRARRQTDPGEPAPDAG